MIATFDPSIIPMVQRDIYINFHVKKKKHLCSTPPRVIDNRMGHLVQKKESNKKLRANSTQLAVYFINDLQMTLNLLPNGVPLIQAICLFGRNEIGLDCRWSKLQIEVAYGLKNLFKLCSKVLKLKIERILRRDRK